MAVLSVVVPVYNEAPTIEKILEKINAVPIDKEIIVVDNCSQDGTQAILQNILKKTEYYNCRGIFHTYNKGKGESVREGISIATGEFLVIQDADLEYEPNDYLELMKPLKDASADLTVGARFTREYSGMKMHQMGNRFLTAMINMLFGTRLNDYASCYKMARRQTWAALGLTARGFDIEVDIVCSALKKRLRIAEVPIMYYPRRYAEGKKIRWFDGIAAIMAILKERVTR
jgi:glycosyltransferase involved in cell wall biosynthesis